MRIIYTLLFLSFSFSLLAQKVSTFYQSSGIDDGLAIDADGNLYGAQYTGANVWKITPDGERTAFVTGLNTPNGLAFDSEGFLFIVDNQGGEILKVAPDGTSSSHVPNIFSPSGIVKMPQSDTMVVSSWEGDKLHKVAPDGSVEDYIIGMGLEGPVGMVYDENETLFIGNYNNRWIFKVNAAGTLDTITQLTVPGSNIGFISYREGFIYATIPWDHKIYKVDMDGNYELYAGGSAGNTDGDVAEARFNGPNGILLSPDGEQFYISDFNTRSVRIISELDGMTSGSNFIHISSVKESSLSPNPTLQTSNLSFTLYSTQSTTIRLYDIHGHLLKVLVEKKSFSAGENNISIDLNEFPAGTYFIQITTTSGDELVKKLVKG